MIRQKTTIDPIRARVLFDAFRRWILNPSIETTLIPDSPDLTWDLLAKNGFMFDWKPDQWVISWPVGPRTTELADKLRLEIHSEVITP